ncbi:MAG: hypothetical protein ABWZ76_03845 [Acidimicrobiales bacterium]
MPVTSELRLLVPLEPSGSDIVASVSGRSHVIAPNDQGVEELSLEFDGTTCVFRMRDGRGDHEVVVGLDDWREGLTTVTGGALHHGYEPDRMGVVAGGNRRASVGP